MRKNRIAKGNGIVRSFRKRLLQVNKTAKSTIDQIYRRPRRRLRAEIELFKSFIITDNRRAKLETYKLKLNRKIDRLENKIKKGENKVNAKRIAKGLEAFAEPNTKRLVELRLHLTAKREQLENAERVIEYVKIRYKEISYSVLFGEEESRAREERDLMFHELLHNVFILGKKAVIVLLIATFSMLQFQNVAVNFSAYTIFRISYSLFSLVLSIYLGVSDGDKFVRGQMCDVLRRRINYVQGFIEKKESGSSLNQQQESVATM